MVTRRPQLERLDSLDNHFEPLFYRRSLGFVLGLSGLGCLRCPRWLKFLAGKSKKICSKKSGDGLDSDCGLRNFEGRGAVRLGVFGVRSSGADSTSPTPLQTALCGSKTTSAAGKQQKQGDFSIRRGHLQKQRKSPEGYLQVLPQTSNRK